jgi:acetyl-CoA carboxylase biotin carboxylase subunit
MFKKVLVANRGEIAVRLLRTLREMNIASVAIFSDADADAPHRTMADEAANLGDPAPQQSYLSIDKILRIAAERKVDAILPGYGFLAESAAFASACRESNVCFVGPTPEVIEQMGSKQNAREQMMRAGVPVVPGGPATTLAEAQRSASSIGYPVLLKAIAGGGGRGMRLVEDESELEAALLLAQSEAQRAFADGTVYLEKYVRGARHVEVQVLGDQHGNVLHLFERDCSIQRRHQKLLEETPCPALSEATRAALLEAALRGARSVAYSSAGTFEFLLAPSGEFYFIEMNTRLQVEHTVTEMVTGLDLVREMLRVAAGEPLGLTQEQVVRRGYAMQCRVCAEDPESNFSPSAGVVSFLAEPSGPFVRLDSGIRTGQRISSYYDSLLCKVCVWAETRPLLLQRMARALDEFAIGGLATNLEFHRRLVAQPDFTAALYDTSFIAEHPDLLAREGELAPAALAALVVEQHLSAAHSLRLENVELSRWTASARRGITG